MSAINKIKNDIREDIWLISLMDCWMITKNIPNSYKIDY